jgi:hypothetical protein
MVLVSPLDNTGVLTSKRGETKKESFVIDLTADDDDDEASSAPLQEDDAITTPLHPECPKCQRASQKSARDAAAAAAAAQYKLALPEDVQLVKTVLGQVKTSNLRRVLEAWMCNPNVLTQTVEPAAKKRRYY